MKRIITASVWALVLTACSEPTSPSAMLDAAPLLARKAPVDPLQVTGTLQNNTFTFAADGFARTGSSNTILSILDQTEQSIGAVYLEELPAQPDNFVLGRLNNEQVVIEILPGATKFEIAFDFYAIGSWDGTGQQAQHGTFGQDSWQLSAKCGDSFVDVFTTTFSNQKSVQQNYPNAVSGRATQWLSKSSGSNVTGFNPPVPVFSSVKDSRYELSFKGANPCGSATFSALYLAIPGFDLQSRSDESWALDNLNVKTDNN